MQPRELHRWDVSPGEAARIQAELRGQLVLKDGVRPADIRFVAGADIAYARRGARTTAFAALVVFSFPDLALVETRLVRQEVAFPYVPGLLSFREGPAILEACRQLTSEPDVLLFDAQGYAHPRRLGAASHLGLLLDRPSIGCAKSRLVGQYEPPGPEFGARTPLIDRGETIGMVVRTRPGRAPLFVSAGHRISLPTAVAIVLACCRQQSLMPEPTRVADRLVRAEARAGRA